MIKVKNQITKKLIYLPLGDVADKQAIYLAKNLAGKNMPYNGVSNSFATQFLDRKVAATGLTLSQAIEAGFDAATTVVSGVTKTGSFENQGGGLMEIVYDERTYKILGAIMCGDEAIAQFIDQVSLAIYNNMTFDQLLDVDYAYSPTNSSVWNPLLAGYRRVMKGKL